MSPNEDRTSVWNEVAELYGEGVSPFGRFSALLVEAAGLSTGDRVLDLGTGNGLGLVPAALAVAPAVVVGVDFSSEMLEVAGRRAAAAGVSNIDLRQMDVAHLQLPDDTFDVAIASSVFQFVAYSPDVLVEWRRVLRPGGRLIFSIPEPATDPGMQVLMELIREHDDRLPPEMAARVRSIQTGRQPPPELPSLCLAAGFRQATGGRLTPDLAAVDVDEWWELQWSHGIRVFLREFASDTLAEIKRAAAVRLEPLRRDDGTIPLVLSMAMCRAVK